MRKALSLALTVCVCYSLPVFAQRDSTQLDAGVLVLPRNLTQTITIKGSDLEKMPFTDLSTALGAWLYGDYSSGYTLTYVVDGNIVSDVNAYSVYDIEEVVLVQNSVAQANLGPGMQQLVLITTKKGAKGKKGGDVAVQDGLVTASGHTTHLYQQYYARAYASSGDMRYGLSANFQQDAFPSVKGDGYQTVDAQVLKRLRLNGYWAMQLGGKNDIEVHVGYAPQEMDSTIIYPGYALSGGTVSKERNATAHQHIWLPWARWHSEWIPGLLNDLQVGYESGSQKEQGRNGNITSASVGDTSSAYNDLATTGHLYIRDRVSYRISAKDWVITPSLNASYEHFNDQISLVSTSVANLPGSNLNISRSGYNTGLAGTFWIVTPALDFRYKDVLDVQGGALTNLSRASGLSFRRRLYPFASLSWDVLRSLKAGSCTGLTIFGSYAERDAMSESAYLLDNLSGVNGLGNYAPVGTSVSGLPVSGLPVSGLPGSGFPIVYYSAPDIRFWSWSLGARLALCNDVLTLSYHFEQYNNQDRIELPTTGGYAVRYVEEKADLHNVNVRVKVVHQTNLEWETGLSATAILHAIPLYTISSFSSDFGEYSVKSPSWTGGWVNRLRYKAFLLGFDMQYHFSEMIGGASGYSRDNLYLGQLLYAGYRLQLKGDRPLEVYVNARNLFWHYPSSASYVVPQYFGVGGKVSI